MCADSVRAHKDNESPYTLLPLHLEHASEKEAGRDSSTLHDQSLTQNDSNPRKEKVLPRGFQEKNQAYQVEFFFNDLKQGTN